MIASRPGSVSAIVGTFGSGSERRRLTRLGMEQAAGPPEEYVAHLK
jgi:hypothetical protein